MPGHMGDQECTTQNLVVMQVRESDGAILISGAIPGAKGCYVEVRPAVKKLQTVRSTFGIKVVEPGDKKQVNPAKKNKK